MNATTNRTKKATSWVRKAVPSGASGPGSAGAVLHRIVDDDRTTGGVVGDIGSHLLALRRRPRRGHCRSVSELRLEDREVRRLSLRRCHLEAVAPREQAG